MKLLTELQEASKATAMSVSDIVEWWTARARCVRCDRLNHIQCCDMDNMRIDFPANEGCIHFEG